MGLFKKRSDPAEMEAIKADIAAMAARLDQADADKAELGTRVHQLSSRFNTPISSPPAEPPPPPIDPAPPISEAELDMLRARVQRLFDRMDQIDARITSISTELANQLTELSGDVEALSADRGAAPDDVVAEIREAQVRLAGEQARYQIAFREDLAELAERLRRP
jgi:hypothetical protein